MPTDVAVIIVNYNTPEMAIAAADSVLNRSEDGLSVAVHLVDNASSGNDRSLFLQESARWGDAVTLHLETVNHGFGRGNNLVLRQLAASPDPPRKVYLLNPDARLVTNAVAEMAAFLDSRPKAAVVGSEILHHRTLEPVACAFRFPGIISEFSGATHFGPVDRLFRRWRVTLPPGISTCQVDWVAGASMMARLDALEKVGFFDPDYFLYFEEVDLMHRLKRLGWEVWHFPQAKVVHIAGASTGVHSEDAGSRRLPGYWFDSWRLYYEKMHGRGVARCVALSRLSGTVIGDLLCRIRRIPGRNPLNFAEDFRRRVVGPLFSTGSASKDA
jgi:N-acetylglucosaminyl-diphospho-decaprenol L-rhamnosyltransferase